MAARYVFARLPDENVIRSNFQSLEFDLNDQARWEFFLTYSTSIRGAVTTSLHSMGNSAILDDEDDKVRRTRIAPVALCFA